MDSQSLGCHVHGKHSETLWAEADLKIRGNGYVVRGFQSYVWTHSTPNAYGHLYVGCTLDAAPQLNLCSRFFWCDAFKQLFLPGPEKPQDSQTHHSESTKPGALGFA